MPRGRKSSNPQSLRLQIADIDTEIETYKRKISDAKEKRKKLMERKEKEEMTALYQAVKSSGKTAEEFLTDLQKQQDD